LISSGKISPIGEKRKWRFSEGIEKASRKDSRKKEDWENGNEERECASRGSENKKGQGKGKGGTNQRFPGEGRLNQGSQCHLHDQRR
jgi:hypothetical protein